MRHTKLLLFAVLSLYSIHSYSTHIRAGEIIARRLDNVSRTFQFTFFGYRDVDGVLFGQGQFDFGDGTIYGDDADEPIRWQQPVDLGNGVERWSFTLTHTYQAPNSYKVSYKEDFRNDGILNIAGSVSTSFYVETMVVIDPFIGLNNTPVFTVPPIDQGVVGFRFEHNPGAYDPDGDSLSYHFVTPKQGRDLDVGGYRTLINPAFYTSFNTGNQASNGPPTLNLDASSGNMVWDSPGGALIPALENREYNVAFIVREWRKIGGEWTQLGFVTRDMQIIIWNFDNEPPDLEVPPDTCVIAGNKVTATITATDKDGDPVKIEAYGGPFIINPPRADYSPRPAPFQKIPAKLEFTWQTACGHVRARPYDVQFKATDDPSIVIPGRGGSIEPPGTPNFETWKITVVGPAPTGLKADTQTGRRIKLDWDTYSCSNADSMQVWRRVESFKIDPNCNPGIPAGSGYELINTVPLNQTTYLDNNNGLGLSPGSVYCYRLVATFPGNSAGESIVSEEACDSLQIDVPVITNVDVKSTSETSGDVLVRWTPPYQINQAQFPPSYSYELLRTDGAGPGGTYTSVVKNLSDTVFTDKGLNTKNNFYAYRVALTDGNNTRVDTSVAASNIRISTSSQVGSIGLSWTGKTPWSLSVQGFPYHYIYRNNVNSNASQLVLIDSVDVTKKGLTYIDDGRFNNKKLDVDTEYCYYVITQGSYGHTLLPEPLLNSTQIACAQPNDTIPPCVPIDISFDQSPGFSCEVQTRNNNCDFNDYRNKLVWGEDRKTGCEDDIQKYRIYISENGEAGPFKLLGETTQTSFIHGGLSSLAFCYQITSVDRSGNESPRSATFCNDNCPNYALPNFFSPNGDGKNDLFRPYYSGSLFTAKSLDNISRFGCPRFVRSVEFKVFNRTGDVLFEYNSADNENNILIGWDGKTRDGRELPAGLYYYSAEVRFVRLRPKDELQVINGWVQILR